MSHAQKWRCLWLTTLRPALNLLQGTLSLPLWKNDWGPIHVTLWWIEGGNTNNNHEPMEKALIGTMELGRLDTNLLLNLGELIEYTRLMNALMPQVIANIPFITSIAAFVQKHLDRISQEIPFEGHQSSSSQNEGWYKSHRPVQAHCE